MPKKMLLYMFSILEFNEFVSVRGHLKSVMFCHKSGQVLMKHMTLNDHENSIVVKI